MPAIMHILGWQAEGLRCPDHEIKCADKNDTPFPVTLIQMPNGTGKTTTLELLRAALSGAAIEPGWDRNKILEFRKRNSDKQEGYFEVALQLNNRRATIRMDFDFENDRVSYKTTVSGGRRVGFYPPPDFRRFMNEEFVRFYVFNGELAQQLLDREYTDAQIVVESLFQITTFNEMAKKVTEYWDQKADNASAKGVKGLTRRKKRVSFLRDRIAKLKKEQKDMQDKRSGLVAQLQKTQDEYHLEIKKVEARSQTFSQAKIKVEKLKGELREEALEVLDRMRDPHALSSSFAHSMLAFKDGLDRVKLPESASSEFFEDLAEEEECVCGRPIDAEIAETIRIRADRYLGSDDVSLLNSIKTVIKDEIGQVPDNAEKDLTKKVASLSEVAVRTRDARNDLDSLEREAGEADPAVKSAQDKINSLQREIKKLDEGLEKFDSQDDTQKDERTSGIKILERRLETAERKLAEITKMLVEKAKRDTLTKIINSAHKKAQDGITTELCSQANARISTLMPYNNISIDRIQKNLILEGQEAGSEGETLSIAYAFLASLFNRAEHQLPFVVDSPVGKIDNTVRSKIGVLIPKLTKQFIAFTISSERSSFIEPLKHACKTGVRFITLFRKGSVQLQLEEQKKGSVSQTVDGLIVSGEEFFNDFQLKKEEDV